MDKCILYSNLRCSICYRKKAKTLAIVEKLRQLSKVLFLFSF
jgi:hypothetical protein